MSDIYRIRQWDDMAEKYGLDYGKIFHINDVFLPEMKHLCGNRIAGFFEQGVLILKDTKSRRGYWTIRKWMVEEPEPKIVYAPNSSDPCNIKHNTENFQLLIDSIHQEAKKKPQHHQELLKLIKEFSEK